MQLKSLSPIVATFHNVGGRDTPGGGLGFFSLSTSPSPTPYPELEGGMVETSLPRIEIGYDLIPDTSLNRESLDLRGVGNHTYREDYTKQDFDHILSDQKDWKFSAISSLNSIFLR